MISRVWTKSQQTREQVFPSKSPGGFCAESKTVLGKAQYPRVKTSQGFYCSGFINPTNKQTSRAWLSSISTSENVSGVLLLGFYSPNKQTTNKLYTGITPHKWISLDLINPRPYWPPSRVGQDREV